jgi:hypothetical protein
VASFVSPINLYSECPSSLLKALAKSNPNREVWLCSFFKEKWNIQSMNIYRKITLGKYRALCKKGASKAIPTMCVLTVKRDENLNPLRAKSWIVVLGNHKDHVWSKCNHFVSVLHSNSLWFLVLMVAKKHHPLRQGNCKNAFCQGVLPPEEVTIAQPPSGDPEAEPNEYWLVLWTLYGLCRSPQHWYQKITNIFLCISLTPSREDPCLFTGFV